MEQKIQEKVAKLQTIQQKLNSLTLQRQNFQSQLFEIENALIEMKDASEVYKVNGQVMVLSDKQDLERNLSEKKKLLEIRSESFEKEENKLKKEFEEMQKDVMNGIENDKKK